MERSWETMPPGGMEAADLATIFQRPGPFVTVYLTTEAEVENARGLSEQRWRNLRQGLEAAGASAEVLQDIEATVPDAHLEGECLVVVADRDGVVLVEHQPEPPSRDVGRVAALPALGPLLEWRQLSPAHVVVLADREGADLLAVGPSGTESSSAGGGTDPLAASAPGGWSQRRYQQRAEKVWADNAEDVAKEVTRLIEEVGAAVVLVAGDVRATQLLRSALAEPVRGLVKTISGSRTEDGSLDHLADEIVRQLATVSAADTVRVLEALRAGYERGRAVAGPAGTLAALAKGQVGLLAFHADPDDDRTAWFGPEPTQVGTRDATVRDMGVAEPTEAPLVDVAIRAALGTGARLRSVPGRGGPEGGLGALLRWADEDPAIRAEAGTPR